MFELLVTNRGICGPSGPVDVQLCCGQCRAQQPAQIRNSAWNTLTCSNCRATGRQYVRVSPSTVDPLNGRVGSVSVQPGFFDWKKLGGWSAFLGPPDERRAPLCFQFVQRGLPGHTFRFEFTAQRMDNQRVVSEQEIVWKACHCPVPICRHNRFVRWLGPTDVWDQDRLVCDTQLTMENGEVVFQGPVELNIAASRTAEGESPAPTEGDATPPAAEQEPPIAEPTEAEIVDRFHRLYYDGSADEVQVWTRTFWMNVPCLQCPLDLWVYQEILTEIRPDVIIETGTLFGGNALFLAHVLDLIGHGRIVSIDIFDLPRVEHPRIEYIQGSSTDATLVRRLMAERPAQKRMVILDSDHTRDHVLAELRLFAPLVSEGSYLIVTDSNINGHPVFPAYGPGPFEAAADFLAECDEFQVDRSREKHKLTFNPSGFLKRIRGPLGNHAG